MMPLPAVFLGAPIAHRGYHKLRDGRPENTLAAVRAAMEAGYGIEIDVQPSADGVAMVFHDDELTRLTGAAGPVTARTAAELAALPVLGTAEPVPRLTEVLAEVAGKVPLVIEIKDQSHRLAPVDGRLEAAVAADLAGYAGPVAVMSFNPHSVAHMARLAPEVPRGIVTCSYREDWWEGLAKAERARLRPVPDYGPTGSCFISHAHLDLTSPHVKALKRQGAAVLCWTIKSRADEARARLIADNVTFEGYAADIPP
jgi:glycerophosphoryl diester phosphodiesterase